MKFYSYLNESKKLIIYHGDNYNTTRLVPSLMFHKGNNQVGIGIYFGNLATAEGYGKNIVSIEVNQKNFKDGFSSIEKVIGKKSAMNIMMYINKKDKSFFSILQDYGMEVFSSSEVESNHFEQLFDMMKDQEARNWQIEIAQYSNGKVFIEAWNKFTNVHGLYDKSSNFYSVINTKYKITKVK